jgi:polyisoprenoid-binding protein YceI
MRILLFSFMVSLLAFNASAESFTYELDPTHTNVVWKADHFGFSSPSGKFADVSGKFTLDMDAPEKSSVEVLIKTASIVTGIPKFDEHLKSADFFNVAAMPEAKFVSTGVKKTGEGKAEVKGNMTLLGVTKPVELQVELNKIGKNPFSQRSTAGFSATGSFKRSDFGMSYGTPGVGDVVHLDIEVEGNLQGEKLEQANDKAQ